MAAHQFNDAAPVFDVDLRGHDARVAQSLCDGARAPLVHVGDGHALDAFGVVREVVSRAEPHPPRAEN